MVKIWFNHWFSTAYNIIALNRQANPDFYIIGTNEKERSVLQTVCDEWYTEPVVKGDEYVDYCLQFCKEHEVTVFMPRREMISISRRKEEFEAAGVKVMVDDYEVVSMLNHKDWAFRPSPSTISSPMFRALEMHTGLYRRNTVMSASNLCMMRAGRATV